MQYAALIANWNGSTFIERCLGSALAATRRVEGGLRVLAVDDASGDDSPNIIARQFPSVELMRLQRNVGFGRAVNEGMKALSEPWVFLLNNDLALPADYFERLIESKNDIQKERAGEIFAIGAKTLQWETHEPNHGGMRARWNGRMIVQDPFEAGEIAEAHFVQGGSCLVDREKFLALGGFCDIYEPGYWEDYDICYQALKRGWKNYYEPRAVAFHWGKKSMREKLGDFRLALTIKRNHLLFNWVNLTDQKLLARHCLGLGGLVLSEDGGQTGPAAGWGRALAAAMGKLPITLKTRRARALQATLGDRQILV